MFLVKLFCGCVYCDHEAFYEPLDLFCGGLDLQQQLQQQQRPGVKRENDLLSLCILNKLKTDSELALTVTDSPHMQDWETDMGEFWALIMSHSHNECIHFSICVKFN